MFIFPVCGEKRCCWVLGMGWHKWRGWGRWWKGGGEARTGCWGQKYFLLNVLRRQNWLSEQRLYDVVGALLCHHTSTAVVHSMFCFIQIKQFRGRNILLFVFQLKICLLKFNALTSSQESLLKLLKQYQCHWCHLFHKRVTLESDIHKGVTLESDTRECHKTVILESDKYLYELINDNCWKPTSPALLIFF